VADDPVEDREEPSQAICHSKISERKSWTEIDSAEGHRDAVNRIELMQKERRLDTETSEE
jgi:hypothetical protein